MKKPLCQLLYALSASTALACVAFASPSEPPKKSDAPINGSCASVAMEQQLQRLSLEAAMVDSSVFGQLRLFSGDKAKPAVAPAEASR